MLYMLLYKMVLDRLGLWMEASEQNFPAVLFTGMLYKVVLAFEFVGMKHSNETGDIL